MTTILDIHHSFRQIKDYLKKGKLFCFATDTVYALSCDATIPAAVNQIYSLKNRSFEKPVPVLMRDIAQAKKYVVLNEYAYKLINKFSPGPITYILPALPGTNLAPIISANKTLGIRFPGHSVASIILQKYPYPLVGTSANSVRGKATTDIHEIFQAKLGVDVIINDESDSNMDGVESTIIDLSKDGCYNIVRKGKITQNAIQEALRE